MVSAWDAVIAMVFAALGAALLVYARRGLDATGAVLRRRTCAIGRIPGGPAELEGVVRATQGALTSPSGRPCVAYRIRHEALVASGKSAAWRTTAEDLRAVPAELRDASGACELDLADVEILGPLRREVVRGAPRRRTTETIVPDGATVLVIGEAIASGTRGGEGYRDARPQFTVRAFGGHSVLVSTSGHAGTLWKTAWPALATGLAGLLLVGLAVAVTIASVALGALIR
jgi:hypothetical protein